MIPHFQIRNLREINLPTAIQFIMYYSLNLNTGNRRFQGLFCVHHMQKIKMEMKKPAVQSDLVTWVSFSVLSALQSSARHHF